MCDTHCSAVSTMYCAEHTAVGVDTCVPHSVQECLDKYGIDYWEGYFGALREMGKRIPEEFKLIATVAFDSLKQTHHEFHQQGVRMQIETEKQCQQHIKFYDTANYEDFANESLCHILSLAVPMHLAKELKEYHDCRDQLKHTSSNNKRQVIEEEEEAEEAESEAEEKNKKIVN